MSRCAKSWKGHGQDRWPEPTKGIFHTLGHYAQDLNWDRGWQWGWSLLGDRLGIGQWVMNNSTVCHLFLSLSLLSLFLLQLLFMFYFTLFQVLDCSYLSLWVLPFSESPPHLTRVGGEWMRGCMMFHCQWNWATAKTVINTINHSNFFIRLQHHRQIQLSKHGQQIHMITNCKEIIKA